MWDGAVVTNGRCYTEYGVSVVSKENDIKKKQWKHVIIQDVSDEQLQ